MLTQYIQKEIFPFHVAFCYGNNQVIVKDPKTETADNIKAENFLRIKMHFLVKEMNDN